METLRRAFGPLDSHSGGMRRVGSLAGVTARNGRAATRRLRLAAAAARRIPCLRARAEGFAVALCTPSLPLPVVAKGNLLRFLINYANPACLPARNAKFSKERRLASGESAVGGSRKRSDNDRKALWSCPQATRRGAPVARRDPRKRNATLRYTRMGVERAEGPSRVVRAAP